MALHTLRAMATGGMYDQVGGGFARYSVDRTWPVPHFEKMLYDNALLARAYLHGWQVTGGPLFERMCRETLDWALRELRGPEGAFASALDADSEGVEGKFYVWTLAELREVLGDELGAEAIAHFGMTEGGNFEGRNIPVRATPDPPHRDELRKRLYEARAQRVWPGLDDKRLTSWNALMISALADAGAVLDEPLYRAAAVECADFLVTRMRDDEGACCAPTTAGRRGCAPCSRTTPSCSRRCSRSTRRRSTRAGSPRRARSPTRSSSASPTPRAAASSRPRTTTSS